MATTSPETFSSWDRRVGLADAGWRKVMMWVFIITDGLIFAGFLASYGFARLTVPDWPPRDEIFSFPYLAAMTFVLISSSATMASAVAAMRQKSAGPAARYIWLTMLGGAIFLGMQAWEWAEIIGHGASLTANPWGTSLFGAYFFLLTGFHGTHVLSGLVVLAVTAIRLGSGRTREEGVEMAGLYWHFVDLVWVFIFTLFYLI
ncbi:MAG: cytochrome c oxidase subunit 3 [Thermoanaerobaculia bacterium]|nr:cytochrome c oxidase subunit 3 [Thermoanaerobaculia bacterium]